MWRWVIALALVVGCKVRDPAPVTARWTDDFGRSKVGLDYLMTGPTYEIDDGALHAHDAAGHPLWLRKKLPHDVRIDLDAWTDDPHGEIRIELFGDGRAMEPDIHHYVSTGYELILGGSGPRIARLDELGRDIVGRAVPTPVPGHRYHYRIERSGTKLTWYVDDLAHPLLVMDDPHPLEGAGHEYFAFADGPADTWFDHLVITPL